MTWHGLGCFLQVNREIHFVIESVQITLGDSIHAVRLDHLKLFQLRGITGHLAADRGELRNQASRGWASALMDAA